MDLKRVKKEAAELSNDSDSAGVSAKPMGEDMKRWKGTISGPKDTPYDGGTFVIDIELTSGYPFQPPKMKFDTKVWHPNVSSQTVAICLDILKKEWSPALTIKTSLISVQASPATRRMASSQKNAPVTSKSGSGPQDCGQSSMQWQAATPRCWRRSWKWASARTRYLLALFAVQELSALSGSHSADCGSHRAHRLSSPLGAQARKALCDAGGDMNAAVEKLLVGA
jgi:ubiquitin-conjugating enzyme (huntingtin interacting protein 2)